jgi:predicted O-methyltransferase YrrM
VEHDLRWYERVANSLKRQNITNVEYILHEDSGETDDGSEKDAAYVMMAHNFARSSLDCVLVDGIHRSACALAILEKIKPGGLLIVDNANWFLPSHSISPNSRNVTQGPASPCWENFSREVDTWRTIWTSNGVWDTAIWIKPC